MAPVGSPAQSGTDIDPVVGPKIQLVRTTLYCDTARGHIIGDERGFLKLLFREGDMRLLGVHVMGEHATDVVHIGLIAMLQGADANLFNRACFNCPTLGDLYKFVTYDAILQRNSIEVTHSQAERT